MVAAKMGEPSAHAAAVAAKILSVGASAEEVAPDPLSGAEEPEAPLAACHHALRLAWSHALVWPEGPWKGTATVAAKQRTD